MKIYIRDELLRELERELKEEAGDYFFSQSLVEAHIDDILCDYVYDKTGKHL